MAERPLGTVLITGGASGLGAATALAVAAAGGKAVVLDRVPPEAEVKDAIADFEVVDLADARAAEAAVRAVTFAPAAAPGGADGSVGPPELARGLVPPLLPLAVRTSVVNAGPAELTRTAELIVDGAARTLNLAPFDPARLPPLDPGRLRTELNEHR